MQNAQQAPLTLIFGHLKSTFAARARLPVLRCSIWHVFFRNLFGPPAACPACICVFVIPGPLEVTGGERVLHGSPTASACQCREGARRGTVGGTRASKQQTWSAVARQGNGRATSETHPRKNDFVESLENFVGEISPQRGNTQTFWVQIAPNHLEVYEQLWKLQPGVRTSPDLTYRCFRPTAGPCARSTSHHGSAVHRRRNLSMRRFMRTWRCSALRVAKSRNCQRRGEFWPEFGRICPADLWKSSRSCDNLGCEHKRHLCTVLG